jgi:hypothetical protein
MGQKHKRLDGSLRKKHIEIVWEFPIARIAAAAAHLQGKGCSTGDTPALAYLQL